MAYAGAAGGIAIAKRFSMASALDEEQDRHATAIRIDAAMQGILSYLRLHPESTDSLRGVLLWLRLLPDELSEPIVGQALQRLVERGEIEAWRVTGGTTVYGRGRPF
jgi:hypothetical protein